MTKLKIANLYYDIMNLYGENANIRALVKFAEYQGIQTEVHNLTIGDKIDFEELNNKLVDKIVLVGRFKYDMLTRMIYAGISKSKIILIEDLNNELISVLRNKTKGSIYSCTCFDKEIELKSLLKKEGITND